MTEPVAYIQIKDGKAYSVLRKGTPNDEYTPVYTAEQLHPRVKMTQAEFDEWQSLDFENNIFGMLSQLLDDVLEPDYQNLTYRVYGSNASDIEDDIKQLELCELWTNYNPDNPEETIEIVPDMKWFVRSKEKDIDGDFWYLKKTEQFFFREYVKENSTQFETKEEAEKWTNPLTEAVQLPVEDE